jgi:hypothetical protein
MKRLSKIVSEFRDTVQYVVDCVARDAELQVARAKHGRWPEKLAACHGCTVSEATKLMDKVPDATTAEAVLIMARVSGNSWADVLKSMGVKSFYD